MNEELKGQRIDQWLWHARFMKSRSLAQRMIESGKIRINQQKVRDPSKKIRPGAVLTITLSRSIRVIEILELASNRGPYSQARRMYRDLAET